MSNKKVREIEGPYCKEASAILNVSQGHPSYSQALNSNHQVGHPRFHVLCSKNYDKAQIINNLYTLGCTELVTEQGNRKTAFLTREDQNRALHEILTSSYGRRALEMLNPGTNELVLKVATNQLIENKNLMTIVKLGWQLKTKHHHNKPVVHVKTFYPTEQYVDGYVLSVTIN